MRIYREIVMAYAPPAVIEQLKAIESVACKERMARRERLERERELSVILQRELSKRHEGERRAL